MVRTHRLLDQPVFVSPARATVVQRRGPMGPPPIEGPCPFCPEHEALRGRVLELRTTPVGDRLRVIENGYPIVEGALGRHELVLESDRHDADFPSYPRSHTFALLSLVRDRVNRHLDVPGHHAVHVFRNRGLRSGASQPHPHLQIVAAGAPLPDAERRDAVARAHHARTGRGLLDDLLSDELSDPARVVAENDAAVAVVPHAPLRNFELWLVPRRARGSLADADDATLEGFAALLGPVVGAALRASGCDDYNLLFRTLPARARHAPHAYWLLEVLPRGTMFAGFELLTGGSVIMEDPERYAVRVRDALRRFEPEALG